MPIKNLWVERTTCKLQEPVNPQAKTGFQTLRTQMWIPILKTCFASQWIGATLASQGSHSVLHLSNCWDVFSGQSTHIPYSSDASRSTDIWDFYPSPKPPSKDKTSTNIYNHLTTKLSGILTVESSKTRENHLSTQQKDIPINGGGPFFLHTNHTKPMVLTTGSLSGIISKANALSREPWRCFLIGAGKRSLIGIDNK